MELQQITLGLDEVGRGALAGPVVVGAAAIREEKGELIAQLLTDCKLKTVGDSKKLTPLQREAVFSFCQSRIIWGIGEAEAAEIDHFGLSAALRLAAERALASIKKQGYIPTEIMADAGLHHPFENIIPTQHFIKGDEILLEITLASIMAKVWRDRHMRELSQEYPGYGWEKNVGYGSLVHRKALRDMGATPLHRQLFLRTFYSQDNMV